MRDNSLRSGERQVAKHINDIEQFHRWRYEEAAKYLCSTDSVLDLCCGVGYGTHILSNYCEKIIGVDISEEAVDYAGENWSGKNICYAVADAVSIVDPFDVVVCYEGIEHVEYTFKLFESFQKINPKLFIVSTPHYLCPIGGNTFHYKHFGMDELINFYDKIGYKIKRGELLYFRGGLNNFCVFEKR